MGSAVGKTPDPTNTKTATVRGGEGDRYEADVRVLEKRFKLRHVFLEARPHTEPEQELSGNDCGENDLLGPPDSNRDFAVASHQR